MPLMESFTTNGMHKNYQGITILIDFLGNVAYIMSQDVE